MIPEEDIPALKAVGVAEVFGPGTSTDDREVRAARMRQDKAAETAGSRSDWKAGTRRSEIREGTMKILKIDHIGIAAKSIDQVAPFWNADSGPANPGKRQWRNRRPPRLSAGGGK